MKKNGTMIGLAALTSAVLLLSACSPAFEPSGDDFAGDWTAIRNQANSTNGPKWLGVAGVALDGGANLNFGPNAAVTLTFSEQNSSGFSLNEAGLRAGVSFTEVTGNGTNSAPDFNKPNALGSTISYTVKSLTNNSARLELNLNSVTYDTILLKIDAEKFEADHGLKLNGDNDDKPGEPEDSYYGYIDVVLNGVTHAPLLVITGTNTPDPAGTVTFTGGSFAYDNGSASGSGLVNAYYLTVPEVTDATERDGVRTFLQSNLVVEKLAPGSRNPAPVTTTVAWDAGVGEWKAGLSGIAEGDILTIKVKNLKSYTSVNTYNGYKLKGSTQNNGPDEQILVNAERVGFIAGSVTAKSQWVALNTVFSNATIEEDGKRNYRIVLTLGNVSAIGINGLSAATLANPDLFKIQRNIGNYHDYVNVKEVTTRTTTVAASTGGAATTKVTAIVLVLDDGFNTLGSGTTPSWNVLVSPAAKTAADSISNGGYDLDSRFVGTPGAVGSNSYNRAPYYGWGSVAGTGTL